MLIGGAYLSQGSWIRAIRQEINYNADDLKKIINSEIFQEYFGDKEGEILKRASKGFEPDHPEFELQIDVRNKYFTFIIGILVTEYLLIFVA